MRFASLRLPLREQIHTVQDICIPTFAHVDVPTRVTHCVPQAPHHLRLPVTELRRA